MSDYPLFDHYCPRCTAPIYDGDPVGESGIYQSEGVSALCESCFFDEDDEIEQKGTNNLPDTLVWYRHNDKELNNNG